MCKHISNMPDYLDFWKGHRPSGHRNNLLHMSKPITNVYFYLKNEGRDWGSSNNFLFLFHLQFVGISANKHILFRLRIYIV